MARDAGKSFRWIAALLTAITLLPLVVLDYALQDDYARHHEFPSRRITVIVPFSQGGGSDKFARAIKKGIDDNRLLPVPFVIENVEGGGATIGSRRAKNKRPDGYTMLLLHEAIITAKYSGNAPYGPEAFEPVAGTGKQGLVIAVRQDSPFKDLRQLMDHVAEKPDHVVYAANYYTPSHFAGLMLEKEYQNLRRQETTSQETTSQENTDDSTPVLAATFLFTNTGGGIHRFNALKGGNAIVSAFSIEEYVRFQPDIRALAYCAPQRHPDAKDVPTSHEQNFPITSVNMQFWWAPLGTPPERIEMLAGVLRQAMESETVQDEMRSSGRDPVFVRGEALQHEIDIRSASIANVAIRKTISLPGIPWWILSMVGVLACLVVLQTVRNWRARALTRPPISESSTSSDEDCRDTPGANWQTRRALVGMLLTAGYVASIQHPWIAFREATIVYVVLLGLYLAPDRWRVLPWLIATAFFLACGIHLVFDRVFLVSLP